MTRQLLQAAACALLLSVACDPGGERGKVATKEQATLVPPDYNCSTYVAYLGRDLGNLSFALTLPGGAFTSTYPITGASGTVTLTTSDGVVFSWSSTVEIRALFIRADLPGTPLGDATNQLWLYTTPAGGAAYGGSGIYTQDSGSVQYPAKWIEFCLDPPPPPVNSAPVAVDGAFTTPEDTSIAITLSASDPNGDPLTWTIVSQPAHGTLSGTAPNLSYQPAANFNGSDAFTFKVNDGALDSNVATVSITVSPVNHAPVAYSQSVTATEDSTKVILLTATDVDGDPLTWTIVSQPAHGTLSGTAPNLSYQPDANFNGSDAFTFKVNDGALDSNVATVSVTVTAAANPPTKASSGGCGCTTGADAAPIAAMAMVLLALRPGRRPRASDAASRWRA